MKILSRTLALIASLFLFSTAAMAAPVTYWNPNNGTMSLKTTDLEALLTNITPTTLDGTTIGGTTPAPATVTNLTATGIVGLSPASHPVTISPTGTGTVTINPATAGALDNVVIGASTPKNGDFVALTATYVTATSFINVSTANTLTATGTTIADALALTKAINNVTTATAGTGVILPNAATVGEGGTVIVLNNGASIIKVYSSDATIDGVAGATGVSLTNAKRCAYMVVGGNFISAQLGTVSG